MKQLIIIGGWEVHTTPEDYYQFLRDFAFLDLPGKWSWKDRLAQAASIEYTVWKPQMPATWRADYEAWKIWFEKMIPDLDTTWYVFVWFSLWAMFLMRYFSENIFPWKINQLHLVSAAWYEAWYAGFCAAKDNLQRLQKQCDNLWLYHSKDDEFVDFDHAERLSKALPLAKFEQFETRWHFLQPAFPELLENIGCYVR
jgi:predicted alpha/beta hydrolase family esterase